MVTLEMMCLRRIGHACEIVGKSFDILQQSYDSRTIVVW